MPFNRTIKLTKPIRQGVISNVFITWSNRTPRPEMSRIPEANQLSSLHKWKAEREVLEDQVAAALDTFSTVNQLEELWPAILPFVPSWATDPEKHITLP